MIYYLIKYSYKPKLDVVYTTPNPISAILALLLPKCIALADGYETPALNLQLPLITPATTNDGNNRGFEQVGNNEEFLTHIITNRAITTNGFLYIYTSNETSNIAAPACR